MINLAGRKDCDEIISTELRHARIQAVRGPMSTGEVKASITGALRWFTFTRAWYYYIVNGAMPLDVALALYDDPLGKDDVRVGGHCGCLSPMDFGAKYLDKDGLQLFEDKDGSQAAELERLGPDFAPDSTWRFADDLKRDAVAGYVATYHVDSEAGLRLLADTIAQIPPLHPMLAEVARKIGGPR